MINPASLVNEKTLRKYTDLPTEGLPLEIVRKHGIVSGPMFDRHWHDHLQCMYFQKGHTTMHCHTGEIKIRPGDILVLNCGELHFSDFLGEPLDFILFKLDLSFLASAMMDACQTNYIQPLADNLILFQNKIRNPDVATCLEEIAKEYEQRSFGFELALKGLACQLLTVLLRKHVEQVLSPTKSEQIASRWKHLDKVLRYMDKHFADEIHLDELAKMAGMGTNYFCRVFLQLTGCTSGEYLGRQRIHKAQELLGNEEDSISEVAFACGFCDSNYFSRTFRKVTGMTPTEYRAEIHT